MAPGTEANRREGDVFHGPLASVLGIAPSEQLDKGSYYPERYGRTGAADGEGEPGADSQSRAPAALLLRPTGSGVFPSYAERSQRF